ncbi:hypothetical protein OG2516_02269 [Oceanicola granulosus HTCC2516]|uniref:DUF1223 domain-containing protein n=1 Tax=Oceanicola granulosus (strain ATCC BAA-861 / DSM 15982 / KCTC 12143 / HTCC2516) TaxID=314256 RepID=Q2CHS0_OCEGH|nr:hypothetical protein OG2516_02269 [Oceanicola granulosus HTCC2516]
MVVELFTSQGCSSCPPADETLRELARRDDVLALALHVDYWDYIGWADAFADPAFTRRQKSYALAAGETMIYTPQMIVGGVDHVIGNRPVEVYDRIMTHAAHDSGIRVQLEPAGDSLAVRVTAERDRGPMVVQLVRYDAEQVVDIERGENAGHTIHYANIVTSWEVISEWDGAAPLETVVERGESPLAVIVQAPGPGPILAAAQLD